MYCIYWVFSLIHNRLFKGQGVENDKKSIACGLILQDFSHTLKDDVVDQIIDRVVHRVTSGPNWDAKLRG